MVRQSEVFRLIRKAYDEKWGYIYGTKGETWTAEKQAAATREQTVRYGSKWIGRRVTDCSGLACFAFRSLGGKMYHGSNTIWNGYVTERSALSGGKRTDGKEIRICDPVFRRRASGNGWDRHHIGFYAGDGKVIEAKGTAYGVVMSGVEAWDETARWLEMEYDVGSGAENGDTSSGPSGPFPLKGKAGETGKEAGTVRTLAAVNLRAGNGTEYRRLATAPAGAEFEYVATAVNGWHAVKNGPLILWVSGKYAETV